jgi:hypothetical protein
MIDEPQAPAEADEPAAGTPAVEAADGPERKFKRKAKKPKSDLPPKPRLKNDAEMLAEFRERFPNAFAAEDAPQRPLALGIHKELKKAGFTFMGVQKAMALLARNPAYLAAVAAGGVRVGLDGEPTGEVTEAQREVARANLEQLAAGVVLAGRFEKPVERKTVAQIELTGLNAKIAITIDAESFRAVLQLDSLGAKAVPVAVVAGGKKYLASLNAKSFRKAQAAFQEAANPMVSISGNLKGDIVESAGIQVFDKGAKSAGEGGVQATAEAGPESPAPTQPAPASATPSASPKTPVGLNKPAAAAPVVTVKKKKWPASE